MSDPGRCRRSGHHRSNYKRRNLRLLQALTGEGGPLSVFEETESTVQEKSRQLTPRSGVFRSRHSPVPRVAPGAMP